MIYLVSGSREFADLELVKSTLGKMITHEDSLVHGGARGVDRTCANVAAGVNAAVVEVPAEWDHYGKQAGIVRNLEMITHVNTRMKEGEKAQVLIFWDGQSRGTKHFIEAVKKTKLPVIQIILEVRK